MWWKIVGHYLKVGIPSSWFLGYQFDGSVLLLCIVPCVALAIDIGAIWHRLTCDVCFPRRNALGFRMRRT